MVEANVGNSELWVEKYRPRNYLELLSDEVREFKVIMMLYERFENIIK